HLGVGVVAVHGCVVAIVVPVVVDGSTRPLVAVEAQRAVQVDLTDARPGGLTHRVATGIGGRPGAVVAGATDSHQAGGEDEDVYARERPHIYQPAPALKGRCTQPCTPR